MVLIPALGAFIWYAGKDLRAHLKARRVPLLENLVHLALGAAQLVLIRGALSGDVRSLLVGALATAAFGALDEFAFHRGIPSEESDLHAKAHWALFTVLVLAMVFEEWPRAH